MKKYLHRFAAFLIAAALVCGFACTAAPAYATEPPTGELDFEILVEPATVKKGGSVDVTINCKNTTTYDITDIAFKFSYDQALISPVSSGYSANPDKAIVSFSGGSATVGYSSGTAEGYASITPGQSMSVTFKMQASAGITNDTSVSLSISDAVAYTRRDLASSSTDGSNLSHIFSFKDTPAYTLNISGYSHDADLVSIVPIVNNAEISMSPAFSPDVTEYTVWVTYSIPNFKFTWTKSDANASVQYVPTANNTLVVGENIFRFIVTAEDKTTTKTYTATVRRLDIGEELPEIPEDISNDPGEIEPTESGDMDIPEDIQPTTPEDSDDDAGDSREGGFESEFSLKLSTLLILVGAVIALFILAFTGGYVTHKNASKPPQYTIEDILSAQQMVDMRNRMRADMMMPAALPAPQEPEPEQPEEYGEEEESEETYEDTYEEAPQYPEYQQEYYGYQPGYPPVGEYGNPMNAYPQVDEYGNPIGFAATDEYGNPISGYPQVDEYGNPIDPTSGYNNY